MTEDDDVIARIRDAHAARFGYDIRAIGRDLRERERASGRLLVEPPAESPAGISREPAGDS